MIKYRSVFWGFLLAAALAFSLVACNVDTTPRITSAELGTEVQAGKVVNPRTTFTPQDHMISALVNLENVLGGTNVGAKWYALPQGGAEQLLFESELQLDPLNTTADFTLTANQDWNPGAYKVVIFLNGKEDRTLNFNVQ